MQVQTLSDVSQRLQSSLADTTKAHQAERLKRDNLHKQVMPLLCLATLVALANACIGDLVNQFCQPRAAALLHVARPATKHTLLTLKLLRTPLADSPLTLAPVIQEGHTHIQHWQLQYSIMQANLEVCCC